MSPVNLLLELNYEKYGLISTIAIIIVSTVIIIIALFKWL